jgi:macrodomain Ter protein organizer (MatP/YcbG family)
MWFDIGHWIDSFMSPESMNSIGQQTEGKLTKEEKREHSHTKNGVSFRG